MNQRLVALIFSLLCLTSLRIARAQSEEPKPRRLTLHEAVQIHGGYGYICESEINRLYRATKLLEIGAGTTEVRKLIISGELLKG